MTPLLRLAPQAWPCYLLDWDERERVLKIFLFNS